MNPTARELIARAADEKRTQAFYIEVMNSDTGKCLGIIHKKAEDVNPEWVIGYTGRVHKIATENFDVERGHRVIEVKASAKKPMNITLTLYPTS